MLVQEETSGLIPSVVVVGDRYEGREIHWLDVRCVLIRLVDDSFRRAPAPLAG